eukprot:362645-Chlamydomonas_euryale.AAC.8
MSRTHQSAPARVSCAHQAQFAGLSAGGDHSECCPLMDFALGENILGLVLRLAMCAASHKGTFSQAAV